MALQMKRERIEATLRFVEKNNLGFTTPAIFDKILRFLIVSFPEYSQETLKQDARRVVDILRIKHIRSK